MGKKISLGIIMFVVMLLSSSITPSFAATLKNEIVEPSNNLYSTEGHYVIAFTTATTGTIKTITIAFPSGFAIASAKLIFASGIGSGGVSVVGQTLTYSVNSAVSVPANTNIVIDLGKIINNGVTTLSVTTKDAANNIIDGPTTSPTIALKSITNSMLATGTITDTKISSTAAIAFSKLATGLLPIGITVNSANIVDGSIVDADISNTAAIAFSKLATGLLPSGIMINSANIVDGSVTSSKLGDGILIDVIRFSGGTNGEIPLSSGDFINDGKVYDNLGAIPSASLAGITGTITKFHYSLGQAPSTGGDTVTATVFKNGTATGLSCSVITGSPTSCESTTPISVIPGDLIAVGEKCGGCTNPIGLKKAFVIIEASH